MGFAVGCASFLSAATTARIMRPAASASPRPAASCLFFNPGCSTIDHSRRDRETGSQFAAGNLRWKLLRGRVGGGGEKTRKNAGTAQCSKEVARRDGDLIPITEAGFSGAARVNRGPSMIHARRRESGISRSGELHGRRRSQGPGCIGFRFFAPGPFLSPFFATRPTFFTVRRRPTTGTSAGGFSGDRARNSETWGLIC